jgi:hypothetical protein
VIASEVLRVRLVAYTDPLVLPMLAELSDEYSARYGEGHGFPDLLAEPRRGAAEFGRADGGSASTPSPRSCPAIRRRPSRGSPEPWMPRWSRRRSRSRAI